MFRYILKGSTLSKKSKLLDRNTLKMRSVFALRLLSLFLILFCFNACQSSPKGQDKLISEGSTQTETSKPKLIKVLSQNKAEGSSDAQQLLFLFNDKEGNEQRAMSIEEIPLESRKNVQVVDLARSPEERGSREYIQLFDLSEPHQDGAYRGRIIKRDELERALANAQALPEQVPIILYSTNWCGVCKKARRFMEEQGLAFVEKDIEADRNAARELQEKCERAKVPLGGVPVIDVGGQLMRGFDPNRLLSMLKTK